ncbi:MAG: Glycosyl transferase group 1 [Candidatus Curtissbacteria bacterium GW2011_GWA1_40_47]|uniref:Glycosyl transferase family 1 domain-containing protein n=1 Tax=Candidatus Curtissbacteria bacterium RIFOXYA1_FULL_41_14 TaxID=1797737 RepID=A0A1F5HAP2_9BACT|nr:MAG: Glycosyl transferase group 1 [Candidatus Curtissbacteria bacterium GW2011_GWB1_40_28]KKR62402.1 MAG: hypothetical protein UU00_C0001G0122 [Microgenomates group bacterium GW2011_GWC1_40_35]KKR66397.1 MAG: Glycosyl transferase group 1 [Candidatus Curtissbacteria bacterium GW2011_GWA1_40_47]KKR75155.1 MAG: Glycosyl transferase group 1 [Candidatus Curtissbacteria bacterium GW2011_GWD1_40_8]KKS02570.1 MAG: Glycosyl transferase group 1 [Candidatus Curtissbacteria bacterium GW2011_GWC2_41_21]
MKIGIDISQIVYGTGVSNYTKQLVEALLKIDRKNQYILFGSSLRLNKKLTGFKKQLSQYKNVEFKITHYPPFLLAFLWNKLHIFPIEKFLGEVDVFHSSDWTQPPVRSQRTKKVTTVHDMIAYLFPSSSHPKIVSNQKRRLKIVKAEVDAIITDSETTKEDLVKFLEIPQEKVTVVYLASSVIFKPQDDDKVKEVLEKYKIKKPYILSVATWEPRKNIQKLVDVFEKIQKENPNLSLVLTGKHGWGQDPSFKDNDRIVSTGFIPRDDLTALYSGCRVFVYPSLYEGFGLPILEAMACGTPVITSNNSSMTEIAKDAAILVDPRSESQIKRAIEMVLNLNLDSYQKMVNASLNRARQYTWIKTAKETLKVYEEVVKSSEK